MNLHRPGRTGGNTEFADAALSVVEPHGHFGTLHRKRAGGTYGSAGAAMGALFIVALDFLRGVVDLDTLVFEVTDSLPELFLVTGQFKHHDAFFAWQNGGIQDIERQVEIFGEVTHNWFLSGNSREPQYKDSGIHGNLR